LGSGSAVTEKAYIHLRDRIIQGSLRPGERLSDRELAKNLGVSRTPIREALRRLERDGFVEQHALGGVRIIDLDARQVADLYDLREVLEVHAVRLAIARLTPDTLDGLRNILSRLAQYCDDPAKRGEEILVGLRLHEGIAKASGDSFLYETVCRLLNRMCQVIWIEVVEEDDAAAEETRREHAMIVTLIDRHRADEAERVVRAHIRTAKDHILRILRAREAFNAALAGVTVS